VKELSSENESLKAKLAQDSLGDVSSDMVAVGDFNVIATAVEDVDMNGLRDLGDQLKTKVGEGIVVIASTKDGKVNLIAMATEAAVKKGAHAGNLIKEIAPLVGGGGGGRPNMAQAGGKNPAGVADAVAKAKEAASAQLS
jgi:alanyl-tRNA synthetase